MQRGSFCLNSLSSVLILFSFARCHVCWCIQTCNVYMDSTIIFYFLFCKHAIFNQGDKSRAFLFSLAPFLFSLARWTAWEVGSIAWVGRRMNQDNCHTKMVSTVCFFSWGDCIKNTRRSFGALVLLYVGAEPIHPLVEAFSWRNFDDQFLESSRRKIGTSCVVGTYHLRLQSSDWSPNLSAISAVLMAFGRSCLVANTSSVGSLTLNSSWH